MLYDKIKANNEVFPLAVNQSGVGAPTSNTEGLAGVFYTDTNTNEVYQCTSAEVGNYKWKKLDGIAKTPWELIDTITMNELLPLKISREPDGTQYNFDKFLIKFDCSKAASDSAGVMYFVLKGKTGGYLNEGIYIDMNTRTPYFYLYGEIDSQNSAKMVMARSSKPRSNGIVDYFRMPSFDSMTPSLDTAGARFVEVKINEKIPAGTVITIYAVRSKEAFL